VYDRRVRIALFCPSFGQVGGIETKAEILISAFRAEGHEVAVLARGESAASSAHADVPVVRLPYHQLPRRGRHVARQIRFVRALPGTVGALRRATRDASADVVLTLAVSSYAPYAIALAGAAPVVLSLEGGGPGFARNPRVMRWALRRAARVVAVAGSLARTAAALAPDVGPRLTVIPNGVEPERFAAGPTFAHPRRYVLAVARLSHEKGVDVLLDAFAALRSADVDLVVAGDGPERLRLVAQCEALGLGSRVHFLGAVDFARLPALYRGAALVACPSRWEGLPLVCLEAMASGRAVVATAVDGTPDAVVDGETGLLVPPDDPQALARAIDAVLWKPGWADDLGAHGTAVVRERFDWRGIAARYLDVLREAAGAAHA
jgi:glycogen synthase